jgi:glycosyltransferase involved in cell wall biosynthesis
MFSVIIPTYNRAELLRRTIQSLVAQTYKNFEVIVCDDGSTDHTKEVVASFTKDLNIKYICGKNFGGPARPRNNGIIAAAQEWICFLDHDDWWYPNKLEEISKHLHEGDILYHDLHIYNKKGKTLRKIRGRNLNTPAFIDLMIKGSALATSSVVVKKTILNNVNLFDEDKDLIAVEDFDAWLKIAKLTERFVYVPLSLGGYWVDEGNATEVSEKQIERLTALYKKHEMFLSAADRTKANAIKSYGVGRIKWKLGNYDEAIMLFKLSVKSNNFEINLKSLIMILFIYIISVKK